MFKEKMFKPKVEKDEEQAPKKGKRLGKLALSLSLLFGSGAAGAAPEKNQMKNLENRKGDATFTVKTEKGNEGDDFSIAKSIDTYTTNGNIGGEKKAEKRQAAESPKEFSVEGSGAQTYKSEGNVSPESVGGQKEVDLTGQNVIEPLVVGAERYNPLTEGATSQTKTPGTKKSKGPEKRNK